MYISLLFSKKLIGMYKSIGGAIYIYIYIYMRVCVCVCVCVHARTYVCRGVYCT